MRLMVDADHLQTIHDIVYPSTQRLRPYLTEEATSLFDSQYSQRGNMRVIQVFAFLDYCHLFSQLLLRVSASLWQLTMLFCSKTIE